MTYAQAVILGIVQGLTEFLPVSSSGHLVLVQSLFDITADVITFDIAVHVGTLAAILYVFRHTILELALGAARDARDLAAGKTTAAALIGQSRETRLVLGIILGTIPAVIVGFTLKDAIEGLFTSVLPVMGGLAITGTVLLLTFAVPRGGRRIGPFTGIIIGIAQAVAIVPGISRSGSTISAALFAGVDREEAGVFSFLLAIPAITGAALLEAADLAGTGAFARIAWGPVLAGTAVAFLTGWWSLVVLMRLVKGGRTGWFGFYCLAVAAVGFLWVSG